MARTLLRLSTIAMTRPLGLGTRLAVRRTRGLPSRQRPALRSRCRVGDWDEVQLLVAAMTSCYVAAGASRLGGMQMRSVLGVG